MCCSVMRILLLLFNVRMFAIQLGRKWQWAPYKPRDTGLADPKGNKGWGRKGLSFPFESPARPMQGQ